MGRGMRCLRVIIMIHSVNYYGNGTSQKLLPPKCGNPAYIMLRIPVALLCWNRSMNCFFQVIYKLLRSKLITSPRIGMLEGKFLKTGALHRKIVLANYPTTLTSYDCF